jgi:hypothetical protein
LKAILTINVSGGKGHFTGENKSIEHKLNDTAYDLTNNYNYLCSDQGFYNPGQQIIDPPSPEVSILYNGSALTSNISRYIKQQLYSDKLCNTICKAEKWNVKTFHQVDWEAYKKAFCSFS